MPRSVELTSRSSIPLTSACLNQWLIMDCQRDYVILSNNTAFSYMNHNRQNVMLNVTGPTGALLFDVKPEIALKESLELLF